MSATTMAMALGCAALVLDYLRERRLEQHTTDRIEDHEQRLRAIERPPQRAKGASS